MSTTPPPPPPANPYSSAAAQPLNPADEKTWSILTHVGGIFFSFIPALITYLVFRDRGPFVRHHTATALNFQLTMLIGYIVSGLTMCILVGFVLMALTAIAHLVFTIMATMAASKGQAYRYPFSIRFIR